MSPSPYRARVHIGAGPVVACLLFAAAPLGAAEIVGEWNLDEGACEQARIGYTADGRHESLLREGDAWTTTASGRYRVEDDDTLVVEFEGQAETLQIVALDEATLELRNADAARMDAMGVDSVVFVRCPPRQDPLSG